MNKRRIKFNRGIDEAFYRLGKDRYMKSETAGSGGTDVNAHVACHLIKNAGDIALTHCVRKTFNALSPVKEWKLVNIKERVNDDTIAALNSCDRIIVGGGGLFLPDSNVKAEGVSGWLWAISEDELMKITAPICIFSVGYNYFKGQEVSELFLRSLDTLLGKSTFFGLRSTGSMEAVKSHCDKAHWDKIRFQPCTTNVIRKVFKDIPEKKESKNVCVNIAFDREGRRFGDNRELILTQVAKSIRNISDKGYNIYCTGHVSGDEKILPYLEREGVKYKYKEFSRTLNESMIRFYNDMDVVIGSRTHSQMVPFGLNCRIISLGTHEKIKWFLEDVNALDWYVDLTSDCENICEKITDIFENINEKDRDGTVSRLLDAQERFWEITKKNIEEISSYGS